MDPVWRKATREFHYGLVLARVSHRRFNGIEGGSSLVVERAAQAVLEAVASSGDAVDVEVAWDKTYEMLLKGRLSKNRHPSGRLPIPPCRPGWNGLPWRPPFHPAGCRVECWLTLIG